MVKENASELQTSLKSAWTETEELQNQVTEQNVIIKPLNTKVDNLQLRLDSEKQKRLHLKSSNYLNALKLFSLITSEIFQLTR